MQMRTKATNKPIFVFPSGLCDAMHTHNRIHTEDDKG
jgi:hypothetical protein